MRHPTALPACAALLLATAATAASTARLRPSESAARPGGDKVWCDDVLGCLEITDDWYSVMRPINPLPESRETINTGFFLHTKEDRATDEDVPLVAGDASTVQQSTFSASRPTKLVIHGFQDTGHAGWLKDMAQELLEYGDYNVLRVDWQGGAYAMYSQAAANSRVVGLEVGYLVNWLADEYGLQRGMVHLIGHSLGAHVSGYAGEQVEGLGRISGMDPAGPYFTDTLPMVRLDPTDAVFVDAIHSDGDSIFALGAGTSQPMAHLDFYPNGGHDQPGCEIFGRAPNFLSCSHMRAIDLYRDSIRSSCNFLSHECSSDEDYQQGKCVSCGPENAQCAFMGFHADQYADGSSRENVRFFDYTDEEEPYCYYQYVVSMLAAKPSMAADSMVGKLFGTFYGENGEVIEHVKLTRDDQQITHGEVNNFVFTSHTNVGKVISLDLEWSYESGSQSSSSLFVTTVQVSPLNAYPESARLEQTAALCGGGGNTVQIADGKSASLASSASCQGL